MIINPSSGFDPSGQVKDSSLSRAEERKSKVKESVEQKERSDTVELRDRISRENKLASSQEVEDDEKASEVLAEVKSQILNNEDEGQRAQSNINPSNVINLLS